MEVKPKITKSSLYDASNWFSKLYCSWVIPFFQLFIKHSNFDTNESSVEIEDIDQCAHDDESEILYRKFIINYETCISQFGSQQERPENTTKRKNLFLFRKFLFDKFLRRNLFLLALIRSFKFETIIPFLLFVLQDCVIKPIQPVLIGLIIRYFYQLSQSSLNQHNTSNDVENNSSISTLYCLAITAGLCVSSLLLIASHHPSLQLAMKLSMRVKIVWSSLIYNKCLKLTANSPNYRNLSHLINLMTNDVRRFDEFALMSNYLLIVPIQTVFILAISWYYIGPSCLATFSAFLILAYVLSILGKHLANLRTKSIMHTEHRLRILNEVFRYLRAIKIYTLESKFLAKIISSRRTEIRRLKLPLVFRSIILSFSMVSSRVIMYFSFLLYLLFLDSNEKFYPETVFVSVTLFERLRYSLTWTFPLAISGLHDILASCGRMNEFLQECARTELISLKNQNSNKYMSSRKGVFITNLNTQYLDNSKLSTKESKKFQLQNISLTVESGQNVSIIGPVGSGKSTLLLTLLSEIQIQKADQFEVNGSIAYVSQEVYTLNSTIRENILFGRKFDNSRYKQVIEICALEDDFHSLPLGDQSIVGESGFTLSGGQKARINLARALYSDKDIYLLDDPFSSVDAHLARHIYQRCIESFLCDKCVLIATHQLQFIPNSTNIMLLDNGHSMAYGNFDTLMAHNKRFAEFFNLTKYNSTVDQSSASKLTNADVSSTKVKNAQPKLVETSSNHRTLSAKSKTQEKKSEKNENTNIRVESYQGIISQYWNYLQQGSKGFGSIHLVILTSVLTQISLYLCDHWLTLWNQMSFGRISFFAIYTVIVLSIIIFAVLRSYTFYELCLSASEQTHNRMANKIIRAPINSFDYIPIGKMLNYFTRDIGILDETLPSALFELNLAFSQVLSIVCVILFLNPYMSTVTFAYMFMLYIVRHYYSLPSHVVRKFEVQSRNRIFSHLSSTLNGLTTIRAYSVQDIYRNRFYSLLNDHTSTVFLQLCTSRFFCTIIDLFAFLYIILVLWILFAFSTSTNGSLIGHCLGSVFNLIGVAQWALKRSIDSDLWIMSFQNLSMFEQLPKEEETDFDVVEQNNKQLTDNQMGEIDFDNLSVYYQHPHECRENIYSDQEEERFVLKNINLRIRFGEKIGICGRSGTGKSSLVNALLRFNQHTGHIRFSGNDIESYSMTDLRRKISIIPQYPVIFSGSIRDNLDLFGRFSDCELWTVLDKVQLRPMVESFDSDLDELISIDSQQMSLGQKQLICLARIMLQNNKLVILDEATASVDFHTDKLIQQTIRNVFSNCTVITIAHRLDSIIDCDRILVFDNGCLIEDDIPKKLLENKQSHFTQLVKQTGPKMSARLEASARLHQ